MSNTDKSMLKVVLNHVNWLKFVNLCAAFLTVSFVFNLFLYEFRARNSIASSTAILLINFYLSFSSINARGFFY